MHVQFAAHLAQFLMLLSSGFLSHLAHFSASTPPAESVVALAPTACPCDCGEGRVSDHEIQPTGPWEWGHGIRD